MNYTSQRAGGIGTSNSVVGNMFSASGRRPQENLYLLNGVEYTSASEINNTPGGVSGQLLGVDAVREFSVVKDTYGAEYGKRPGAQINIVTASGTNQLHGNVYEFLRNSALDARNFFDHGDDSAIPAQRVRRLAGRADQEGQDASSSATTKASARSWAERRDAGAGRRAREPSRRRQHPAVAGSVAGGQRAGTADFHGSTSGIAEGFSNPMQHIREDFGTARFDQTFSDKDSFAAVYTVDDSAGHSPTQQSLHVRRHLPARAGGQPERNARLLAQPDQPATSDFRAAAFYFNSGTDRCSLARAGSMPASRSAPGGRRRHDAQRRLADHQRRHQRGKQSERGAQSVYLHRSGHAHARQAPDRASASGSSGCKSTTL